MSESIVWQEKTVKVSEIKPFERNPRRITEKEFTKLVDSLERLGQFSPGIVTHDMRMIGGHQRIRAFNALKWEEIRVSFPNRDLTDDEFKEIVIKSNTTSGTFDIDILASDFELPALMEWGIDEKLLLGAKSSDAAQEDDGPSSPPVDPYSKPGDIWVCGQHRVMCGDATSADAVARLLNGTKPNLCVTDPPYGVEYDAAWRGESHTGDGERLSLGVHAKGKVQNDDRSDWREAFALFPGNIVYAWCASMFSDVAILALESCGFTRRAQIIWAKNNFAISRGDYHWQHEPCWYAVKTKGDWHGDRKQTTLWNIDKPQKSETGHSTQKPLECMQRPMRNNSSEGTIVYDPFLGSGTTVIAAHQINRICYGMEISPAYVDVIVRRWQDFTGEGAVRSDDGTPFPVAPKAKT